MLNEKGVIVGFHKGRMKIEVEPAAGCKNCQGCLAAEGAKRIVTLPFDSKYNIGDTVNLKIDENKALLGSALCYGVPVLGMLFVAIIATFIFGLGDLPAAIITLITPIIVFLIIKKIGISSVSISKDDII